MIDSVIKKIIFILGKNLFKMQLFLKQTNDLEVLYHNYKKNHRFCERKSKKIITKENTKFIETLYFFSLQKEKKWYHIVI